MERDALFREAVAAIDAGDLAALERLLAEHPRLAGERLEEPGDWLRETVGDALDGFFARPYLLWFVAEDPVRSGTLPPNAAELARAMVDAARRHAPETLREQLGHALSLVVWSWIARESGVQIALVDVLVDGAPRARPGCRPAPAEPRPLLARHSPRLGHALPGRARRALPRDRRLPARARSPLNPFPRESACSSWC